MILLRAGELLQTRMKARIPFRYGIATMTEVPHVFLRLGFEIDGKVQRGLSADSLPPKWFTKDPVRSIGEEVDEMLLVIRAAVSHAAGLRAETPFGFWRELHRVQAEWGRANGVPSLLAGFGTSLVERALIDAFCRTEGVDFAAALRRNRFGIDLGSVHGELAGSTPAAWLPGRPCSAALVRHTVGLSDPIEEAEIEVSERVEDSLPQSLAACIRFYGLRSFKLKINGDAERDRARLSAIATVLARECGGEYSFSLDGNESFREVGTFAQYAKSLMRSVADGRFWSRLLFIEQPWHRDVALDPAIAAIGAVWPDRPAIIIDESDSELSSLPTALALGYAGTSHKNCKGVFKGVANACLLAQRRTHGFSVLLSGEDLANVGPVALLQDLAVAASLGISNIERNGHHYFSGLSQFHPHIQRHVLAHHDGLYVRGGKGWPRLNIVGGRIGLDTVIAAPFGYAGEIEPDGFLSEILL